VAIVAPAAVSTHQTIVRRSSRGNRARVFIALLLIQRMMTCGVVVGSRGGCNCLCVALLPAQPRGVNVA
jgi:hypothetical protein